MNRRGFLASASVSALLSALMEPAKAAFASFQVNGVGSTPIGHGWNTLPLGAGGLVTGLSISNDGSMVCRTDVGGIYRWSSTASDFANTSAKWNQLLTFNSLTLIGGNISNNAFGAWEHVLSPGTSTTHLAVFPDMTGLGSTSWLYYSTNSGIGWTKSNLKFTGDSADSNGPLRYIGYKIVVDPANANIAYCGMPVSSGNSSGVYTSLNQAGGSSLGTWSAVTTTPSGTAIAAVSNQISCGLAIDSSMGTRTISGQTVTNHIIVPVGGVGIYESIDGGQNWTEIATSTFGTANFFVFQGGFTAAGVYYCCVSSGVSSAWGLWRWIHGSGWTKITPSGLTSSNFVINGCNLFIDPRANAGSESYLTLTTNGMGAGYTSTNADTTASWNASQNQTTPHLLAASYDIPYLNFIFGQVIGNFLFNPGGAIDPSSGMMFFGGQQSIWYAGTSAVNTAPVSPINFQSATNSYFWSMGRGQEATVCQDVLVPPGGTYPIIGNQDLGAPLRGTFTSYPQDLGVHYHELTASNIEYAADNSIVISNSAGQQGGDAALLYWCYSTSQGADGTWTQLTSQPSTLWNSSGTLNLAGGQVVAVDKDHWFGCPQGTSSFQPGYTTNATGSSTWQLSSGLPSAQWFGSGVPWFFGYPAKPFAVGYGSDLGTVWALLLNGTTTASLYRSTDKGATWGSGAVVTWSINAANVWPILLSVPGQPDELWATAGFTSNGTNASIFHITGARTASTPTVTAIAPPASLIPMGLTLGAPNGSGYPTVYFLGAVSGGAGNGAGGPSNQKIYSGIWNGTSFTWSPFGPTGTQADLPASCQIIGIQAIKGDPNVYGRLYGISQSAGMVYYNP